MKNLDLIAAEGAQEIIAKTRTYMMKEKDGKESEKIIGAGEVDNLVTKALGVLQENGVYAALLYLYSRTSTADKLIAEKTRDKLLSLTSELEIPRAANTSPAIALQFLTEHICNDLDRLLLVKQLWEQTLIYARYGAKARSAAEE